MMRKIFMLQLDRYKLKWSIYTVVLVHLKKAYHRIRMTVRDGAKRTQLYYHRIQQQRKQAHSFKAHKR